MDSQVFQSEPSKMRRSVPRFLQRTSICTWIEWLSPFLAQLPRRSQRSNQSEIHFTAGRDPHLLHLTNSRLPRIVCRVMDVNLCSLDGINGIFVTKLVLFLRKGKTTKQTSNQNFHLYLYICNLLLGFSLCFVSPLNSGRSKC